MNYFIISRIKKTILSISIPKKKNTVVQYDTIDWYHTASANYGEHCLMAKANIYNAFRIIANPADYHLLGFLLDNEFYYDRCLPMGATCII